MSLNKRVHGKVIAFDFDGTISKQSTQAIHMPGGIVDENLAPAFRIDSIDQTILTLQSIRKQPNNAIIIVSFNTKARINRILNALRINNLFDAVITPEIFGLTEDSPYYYNQQCLNYKNNLIQRFTRTKNFYWDNKDVILFDDDINNYQAALQIGIKAIKVGRDGLTQPYISIAKQFALENYDDQNKTTHFCIIL